MFDRSEQSLLSEWWFTVDKTILLLAGLLMGLGIFVSLSASSPIALKRGYGQFYFTHRHLVFIALASGVMLLVSMVSLNNLRRLAAGLFLFCLMLIIYILIMGPQINGARRWLKIAGYSFQPSEVLKPVFLVLTSFAFARKIQKPESLILIPVTLVFLFSIGLFLLQPDFGQSLLLTLSWGTLLFLAGLSFFWIGVLVVCVMFGGLLAYQLFPHVAGRIDSFLGVSGKNYQLSRAGEIFMNSGWFGRGPGEGDLTKYHLPDAHNDFVFTAIANEYGISLCLFIALLYGILTLIIYLRALSLPNFFCYLTACGLGTLFAMQALIHMGVNVGLIPAKGMTLPFLSYGGTSILASGLLLGGVLNVTRKRTYYS